MSASHEPRPAVIVGLCAHGLGLVRDLARSGVPVTVLEQDSRRPGVHTRYANVRYVPDINSDALVEALCQLARTSYADTRPVLLLTNDRMVEVVGRHVPILIRHFCLSWADCADVLLPLLGKDCIEERCREVGLNYPRSQLATDFPALEATVNELHFPVIAKPCRPLSGFKTLVARSLADVLGARQRLDGNFPVLVQEFVPGGDEQIQFGALYLNQGEVLAHFEGRKLHSRPMGHTTIGISAPNGEVFELTKRFFAGLNLSGPVSLELKRDPDGVLWVIEPTVGRTDFWAGLCSANGVNLAQIEYRSVLRMPQVSHLQRTSHLWINGERFPGVLSWLVRNRPKVLLQYRVRGVYFDLRDPAPFLISLARAIGRIPRRLASWCSRRWVSA